MRSRKRSGLIVVLLVTSSALAGLDAGHADTVEVIGAYGGPGEPGEDADANASFVGESIALATAGNGGTGFDGAAAGDATADAIGSPGPAEAYAHANAKGGRGGSGDGGAPGAGGDGDTTATISAPVGFVGTATADAFGRGGQGGTRAAAAVPGFTGSGGDATAFTDAVSLGDADLVSTADAVSGGPGLDFTDGSITDFGPSGGASALATGTGHGDGEVFVEAIARDAISSKVGSIDADRYVADATGHGVGSGEVTVRAVAKTTDGPLLGGGLPKAEATAHGSSDGGGPVHVYSETESQSGALLDVVDSVSGTTSGPLILEQIVRAADEGSVTSSLDASNPGDGDLEMTVQVEGGAFYEIPTTVGLGTVRGESTVGSAVDVTGRVVAGVPLDRIEEAAPHGVDVHLTDAVAAETSGAISLTQEAIASVGATAQADPSGPFPPEVPEDFPPSGDGGDASSYLTRSSGDSLTLEAIAKGGDGGGGLFLELLYGTTSGSGGAADARADGESSGGPVSILALADAGHANAAYATESVAQGGSARVVAGAETSGAGNDVSIGDPTLLASGAHAGLSYGGDGGTAISSSVGVALGDAAVSVYDRAFGGDAFDTGIPIPPCIPGYGCAGIVYLGGEWDGGDAFSSATGESEGDEPVIVSADARAGDGAMDGAGGVAFLGTVYGRSALGGRVEVSGLVEHGSGETAQSVSLVNYVAGDTTGELVLRQIANAGKATGGTPTTAHSELTADRSVASLELDARATGQASGDAIADVTNTGGAALARTFAEGGAAHAVASTTTFGAGHDIYVGPPPGLWYNAESELSAESDATGTAYGDAEVIVESRALGNSVASELPGAHADATATGTNAGSSLVSVLAYASGSRGGIRGPYGPGIARGGDGTALAYAEGGGTVEATASGLAGEGGYGSQSTYLLGPGGIGDARATAVGVDGFALASARTGAGRVRRLDTSAELPVAGRGSAAAGATAQESFARTSISSFGGIGGFDAAIHGVGEPAHADAVTLLESTALQVLAGDIYLMMGEVGAVHDEAGAGPGVIAGSLDLQVNQRPHSGSDLGVIRVGFADLETAGAGFDSLDLQVLVEDVPVVDVHFDDVASATAFFASSWLDLGVYSDQYLDVDVDYSLTLADAGDGAGFLVTVAAPEPDGGVLLAAGVCGLVVLARRRSPTGDVDFRGSGSLRRASSRSGGV